MIREIIERWKLRTEAGGKKNPESRKRKKIWAESTKLSSKYEANEYEGKIWDGKIRTWSKLYNRIYEKKNLTRWAGGDDAVGIETETEMRS